MRVPRYVLGAIALVPVQLSMLPNASALPPLAQVSTRDLATMCERLLDIAEAHSTDAEAPVSSNEASFCFGYFSALEDIFLKLSGAGQPAVAVCLPEQASLRTIIAMYVEKAKLAPERSSEPSLPFVLEIAKEAFPCKAQSARPTRRSSRRFGRRRFRS